MTSPINAHFHHDIVKNHELTRSDEKILDALAQSEFDIEHNIHKSARDELYKIIQNDQACCLVPSQREFELMSADQRSRERENLKKIYMEQYKSLVNEGHIAKKIEIGKSLREDKPMDPLASQKFSDHAERIENLENQLRSLLNKKKTKDSNSDFTQL